MAVPAGRVVAEAFAAHVEAGAEPAAFDSDPLFHGVDFSTLPSLNSVPVHDLVPGSLVKFRCMVQDTFDPELYLDVYETVSPSGERMLQTGRFHDTGNVPPGSYIDQSSPHQVMRSRQTLYCVPIPAETVWVKEAADSPSDSSAAAPGPVESPKRENSKRGADDMDSDDEIGGSETAGSTSSTPVSTAESTLSKRARDTISAAAGPAPACAAAPVATRADPDAFDFNFPIPGETGPAVMVKLYTGDTPLITQMIEVVGIYEIDPAVGVMDETDPFEAEEFRAHHPPPSIVPRIHCVAVQALVHNNPITPQEASEETFAQMALCAPEARAALLEQICGAMQCNELVAEYVLLALVASVYSRQDDSTLVLGKLGLNIFGLTPETHEAVGALVELLSGALPALHYLPLSLDTLNSVSFTPRKNTAANRLEAGYLQVADSTVLVLDECAMDAGHLNAQGVRNVTALGNLIQYQTLEYNFEFSPMTFHTNVRTLVFSEGKSMLPADAHIPMLHEPRPAAPSVSDDIVDKVRQYLTFIRMLPSSIEDEVRSTIQTDFVKMRQADPKNVQGSTLHATLGIARLVSLSRCETSMSSDSWTTACAMEDARRAAVAEALQ